MAVRLSLRRISRAGAGRGWGTVFCLRWKGGRNLACTRRRGMEGWDGGRKGEDVENPLGQEETCCCLGEKQPVAMPACVPNNA